MLAFLHVPRTGGSSLKTALWGTIPRGCWAPQGHWRAEILRGVLSPEVWMRAFRFSWVRNPWDRMLSLFLYTKRHVFPKEAETSVEEIRERFAPWVLQNVAARRFPPVRDQLAIAGKMQMQFVGRFERMEADFQRLTEQLGVEAELPRLNGTGIRAGRPFQAFYSPESRERVAKEAAWEIETFGYRFEET